MEYVLRIIAFVVKCLAFIITPILVLSNKYKIKPVKIPPIQNEHLYISAIDLAAKIRNKEIKSIEIVTAYINRIKEINPILNAVVTERFQDALLDADEADKTVNALDRCELESKYPLLGVPFTVKESCSLKGMSLSVGSLPRKGILATEDGAVVTNLIASGAIPLLVSNTPEYCTSWETDNFVTGLTLNPHNLRRTPGGSSGGEAALIASGASLFGVCSDFGGSIRIPAMFTGVFGHKPTGGLLSLDGHFPNCSDERFKKYLTIGPIFRYSKDISTLIKIMAGKNAEKLGLDRPLNVKDIKVHFMEDAGFSFADVRVQSDIKLAMRNAVKHLKTQGHLVYQAANDLWEETYEITLALFLSFENPPQITQHIDNSNAMDDVYVELKKAIKGKSKYTFKSLVFSGIMNAPNFFSEEKCSEYYKKGQEIRKYLIDLLGNMGVFLYPTYPTTALHHNDSLNKIAGVTYATIFNWLEFPSTNVPLGKDRNGLPIGIQVIAAPMQDRLCFAIASELENAFGGWVKPF